MEGSSKSYHEDVEQAHDLRAKEKEGAKKEKGRVRFNSNAAATGPPPPTSPKSPGLIPEIQLTRPGPPVLRDSPSSSVVTLQDITDSLDNDGEKASAAAAAQERARIMAARLHQDSNAPEARDSFEFGPATGSSGADLIQNDRNIPLQDIGYFNHVRKDSDQTLSEEDPHQVAQEEAYHLVRSHTQRFGGKTEHAPSNDASPPHEKAPLTELNDGQFDGVYGVPPPEQYRGSVLSQLLKLYKPPAEAGHQSRNSVASFTGQSTPGTGSGSATPSRKKWYDQNRSQDTLANLIEASARLANPNETPEQQKSGKKRPKNKRTVSASRLSAYAQKEEHRITIHIAETLSRQEYIIKLCRALMLYGAPTHRLEEYLSMSARVLEIDGQFLYIPGCMIISFDDKSTHTTEVKIVRTAQGIDLGKLKDVHLIYKEVMHDVIGVEEGTLKLDALMSSKDKYHAWLRVLIFGLTSLTAAPFSFKARLIDLPLCFFFGCLVGFLQLIVAPRSNLYSNVFEVSATVLVSFLARAFGSIRGGSLFCFSSLAQGGIVMLLPGYLVCKSTPGLLVNLYQLLTWVTSVLCS